MTAHAADFTQSPPVVWQAEAYCGKDYIAIRNSKTENVLNITKQLLADQINLREVSDFTAFLENIYQFLNNTPITQIIVALGDSTTANYNNWPRILSTLEGRSDLLVVNLADWGFSVENHILVAEHFLKWLNAAMTWKESNVLDISTVMLCGLTEGYLRLGEFIAFSHGERITPLHEHEELLTGHRYGGLLARLTGEFPADKKSVDRWIARRVVALAGLLGAICADAGSRFYGILRPTPYDDLAPGYLNALRRAYQADAAPSGFEEWCRDRGYKIDQSARFDLDLRPILNHLVELWPQQTGGFENSDYLDWSDLFREIDELCWEEDFDALHFNGVGTRLIAEGVIGLVHNAATHRRSREADNSASGHTAVTGGTADGRGRAS